MADDKNITQINAAGAVQATDLIPIAQGDARLRRATGQQVADFVAVSGRYTPPGTGGIATAIAVKLGRFIDVMEYGAAGDGTTDDGPAFQRAIDAAPIGSIIFVPGTNSGYAIRTAVNINKAVHLYGGDSGEGPRIILTTAIVAFTLSATGAALSGLRVEGNRTPNQYGVRVSMPECLVQDMQIDLVDYAVHQNNGNHVRYDNLRMRNIRSCAMWMEDGVGPRIHDCFYDTDLATYAEPLIAGLWVQCEGLQASDSDFIRANCGTFIDVSSTRNIEWMLFVNCFLGDSGVGGPGLRIRNSQSGRYARGIFFVNCWMATHDVGLLVDGSHEITGIKFTACVFHNNKKEGVSCTNNQAFNFTFSGCYFNGNDNENSSKDNVFWNGNSTTRFINCEFNRDYRWITTPRYHLNLGANAGATIVRDCFFDAGGVETGVFNTASSASLTLANNDGLRTKNSGFAAISAGQTSVTVTHGLARTPTDKDILVTPHTGWAGAGQQWWIDDVTSTTFRIVALNAPSGNDFQFSWRADVEAV